MAAISTGGNTSNIRVRLYFDYPPPAVVDSRMCWLLVDLNACRVVADLESIIREKFEFSRGSILNLFIEDCYLPHTESIYVVRDNDSVRVKVHCLTQVNGHSSCPDTSSKNCRKRLRPTEEEESGKHGVSVECERKKRKKRSEKAESLEKQALDAETKKPSPKKHTPEEEKKKKKRKKKKKAEEAVPSVFPKPAASTTKPLTPSQRPVKRTNKPTAKPSNTQEWSSTDSDSSFTIPSTKKTLTSLPPKEDSETQEAPSLLQSTKCIQKQAEEPPSSDSQEETELLRAAVGSQASGRTWCGGPGERGGGEGRGINSRNSGDKEPSYHSDSLTNVSVVLQNGTGSAPKQDYSSLPLLAAPPQVGQKIAFKLLELTENYTPEVSEYKEGKIVSFDPTTKQIELELLHISQAPAEPGKFDLVYQNPDGSESVEYAVSRSAWVTERWDSLLEPRLIL